MTQPVKEPVQPTKSGSGGCLISKSFWTITTTEDGEQLIEEERHTKIVDEALFALADINPGQSLCRNKDGTIVLKESYMKIDSHLSRPTGENVGSWRCQTDRLWTEDVPRSVASTSEEPQDDDEDRSSQDQDQDENE